MIWLHLSASAMVLGASVGLGRLAGKPYRTRLRTLEEWQRWLRHLEPLITWKQMPLKEALGQAAEGQPHLRPAVRRLAERLLSPDCDFAESWVTMLNEMPGLWEDDRNVLRDFGRVLGTVDLASERSELGAVGLEVSRLVGSARTMESHDGRLYPALIGALGVMVVLMML